MKKPGLLAKIIGTIVFLSLLLFNVGMLRGESLPAGRSNLQEQAKRGSLAPGKTRDRHWLEEAGEKHERFLVLEWLIRESLIQQYQRMEIREDSEDNLD